LVKKRENAYGLVESQRGQDSPGFALDVSLEGNREVIRTLIKLYALFAAGVLYLQSPFLLGVRLYWGWQFAQSGSGKLHRLDKITDFFTSLNILFPATNAHFVSGLEFVGGVLLIMGLGSRLSGLLLTGNMLVAYWTADHEALLSVFSDPGAFYVADPCAFLFASALILVFGAGALSFDAFLEKSLAHGSTSDGRSR
jgi:putative oxidoreductase